jgi:hypothetical protein
MDNVIVANPVSAAMMLVLGIVALCGAYAMGKADAREEGFKAGIGYCVPVKADSP